MLSDADRRIVESVALDPLGEPSFEELGRCLAWPDEVPTGLTPEGHDFIRDLLIARGFLHRDIPPARWGSPDRLARWSEAVESGLRWNGFTRLALGPADRAFLVQSLADDGPL